MINVAKLFTVLVSMTDDSKSVVFSICCLYLTPHFQRHRRATCVKHSADNTSTSKMTLSDFRKCCSKLYTKCKEGKKKAELPRNRTPSPYALPTISSPIVPRDFNNTWKWRRYTLNATKALKPPEARCTVLPLPGTKMCVKYGQAVQLSETAGLMLVAEKTSIPVPKVYSAFRHDYTTYIIMDFIEGEQIGKNWAKDLLHTWRCQQLKHFSERWKSGGTDRFRVVRVLP